MGRLGTFVPRLLALTAVWLLATTALTYAAAQRITTTPVPATTPTAPAAAAPTLKLVPDVRRQPFVFAKATLGDAGFSWRVEGAVKGFASNLVRTQTPAAGTRLIDTGSPLIVLRLSRGAGAQSGLPEGASDVAPTAVKLANLTLNAAPARAKAPAAKKIVKATPVRKVASAKDTAAPTKTASAKRVASKPARLAPRWPQNRPPLFTVAGARPEPLDEMPLAVRAKLLLAWLNTSPKASNPNVGHWLYQHAWIVAGARMGWWHGDVALRTLVAADNRVWSLWGIGARSGAIARATLADVDARAK